ncbi:MULTISPECIES: DUF6124 family protein [unclassified Pseudomonas]|uniref:DUF6124 family protein n=1 Tax=unclassified Pseudomonas TaxID=196821 RepID=UPI0013909863|nr:MULTISPECIES: DUF6124 family protein [unclassified Pseudomonas]KAI2694464.1 DUF6124 family protein [Pseudomonas sp. TNT3]MBF4555199.1 hypothetical protein [Pseudomonas sp. p50(2008)]MBH2077902.1 hypothetical protein [Pseudomonadales bacterium]
MFKPTPNPPESDGESTTPDASIHSGIPTDSPHDTLQDYLKSGGQKSTDTPRKPTPLFTIAPDIDTETLLAHACESLASANVMASDLAGFLHGPYRNALLGIAQIVMLAELAVNRALDNIDPQA